MNKKTIAIVIAVFIIIITFVLAGIFSQPKPPAASTATKYSVPERANDYFFGTSTPKVTIVEFSDFACPYCRNDYTVVRAVGYKYQKSVKIIFKDFPLHDTSLDLALAARCAGEQGFFWSMHDKLFSEQGQFATSSLPEIANSLDANKTIFNQCLKNQKYLSDIKNDYLDGQGLGVSGTPTFFINGYKVVGEIPEANFEQLVKQFLK
jgi:protein-disulfide isomerase